MDPALALPEEVEQRVLAILFGRGADQDPDAGIRQLCAERPKLAAAIERLVQHLRAQVADMQRRLGSVWQLSHTEGRYELIEELGRGGLGTVSIARDRMLGRRVALKTIHPRHGERLHEIEPIKVHRFLDEAQIAAQLLHPHIPLVHDLGIGGGGVPYYTMRYVRGQTLASWILGDDGQGRSLAATARVLQHVAEALAYAHGRHVLHRDVKPANVLVGRFGEVCVIDWGLARAISAGSSDGPDGTVSIDRKIDLLSGGLGSEGYVAPEQRRGEFHPASDVFSVAAILHLALLGMPPTTGSEQAHYQLSRTAWRRDRRLAAICQRGVAPRLQDRYPTMAALVSDLQDYLADRVPAACRATVPVVAQLLWRRSRRWVGGLVRGLPAFGGFGGAPRTAPPTATTAPRGEAPGGADRQREAATPAAPAAMPTQFTLASMLPASLDRLQALLDRLDGGSGPQSSGRLAFLAERLDAIRRLSTPMRRFQRPATFAAGGMAVVLRMEDSLLRRQVAVKMLRAQPDAAQSTSRILDEAQIAAQLDHPSILSVHEIGVDGDGQVRMVMPLVQGGQIDQFLQQRRHEWWLTARLLLQIAWGLAFAHQKGVLHRDVKPANIVLGEHGDAYLADWGIALLVGAPGEAGSRLRLHRGPGLDQQGTEETVSEETAGAQLTTTIHGMVVGTPSYMAPESFDFGNTGNVGPHSDVWSLGVILYELLAGRHPYLEQMPRGRWHELRQFLMSTRIPPLRQFAPKVPRGLAAVCARAMQPDPVDRFRDAGAFARALEAVVR